MLGDGLVLVWGSWATFLSEAQRRAHRSQRGRRAGRVGARGVVRVLRRRRLPRKSVQYFTLVAEPRELDRLRSRSTCYGERNQAGERGGSSEVRSEAEYGTDNKSAVVVLAVPTSQFPPRLTRLAVPTSPLHPPAPRHFGARYAVLLPHGERVVAAVDDVQRRAIAQLARHIRASGPGRPARRACPRRNSIGACTSARCAARSRDGLPAAWSGKPWKTSPRTRSSCLLRERVRRHPPAERSCRREQRQPGRFARRDVDRRAHRRLRHRLRVHPVLARLHVRNW